MTKSMKSVKSVVLHFPPYRHPCPGWWDRIRDHGLRGLHGPHVRQDTDRLGVTALVADVLCTVLIDKAVRALQKAAA